MSVFAFITLIITATLFSQVYGFKSIRLSNCKASLSTTCKPVYSSSIDAFSLPISAQEFVDTMIQSILDSTSTTILPFYLDIVNNPSLQSYVRELANQIENIVISPYTIPSSIVIVSIMILFGLGSDDESIGSPFDDGQTAYSSKLLENYYNKKSLFIFRRLLRLSRITGVFNFKLALDYFTKRIEENQVDRAKEALALVTQLGPTFIKLGKLLIRYSLQ